MLQIDLLLWIYIIALGLYLPHELREVHFVQLNKKISKSKQLLQIWRDKKYYEQEKYRNIKDNMYWAIPCQYLSGS